MHDKKKKDLVNVSNCATALITMFSIQKCILGVCVCVGGGVKPVNYNLDKVAQS